jgi:hypothetical protein
MGLLKKLFGAKSEVKEANPNPDNTKLIFYINNWWENRSDKNYKIVVDEILNGNSYLLLPTINDPTSTNTDWQIADADTTLNLTSCFNLDGLKVLGAFTDEKALVAWAKKPTHYTSLKSDAVISICEQNNIGRVVINSGSPNMFVLERNRNMQNYSIKKDTTVHIGTPSKPLNDQIIQKLIARFEENDNIEGAYQYIQELNGEISIMIGIKLFKESENGQTAVLNAVQDAMKDEKSEQFVDVFFIENAEWLDVISNVNDSLFYKK